MFLGLSSERLHLYRRVNVNVLYCNVVGLNWKLWKKSWKLEKKKKPLTPTSCTVCEYLCKVWHLIQGKKAERRRGTASIEERPGSVGAAAGSKGLSLPSHFTQKTWERSANQSAGFENRERVMKSPRSHVHSDWLSLDIKVVGFFLSSDWLTIRKKFVKGTLTNTVTRKELTI